MKIKNDANDADQESAGMVIKTFTMDTEAIAIMNNLCGLSTQKSNSKVVETAMARLFTDITEGGKAKVAQVITHINEVDATIAKDAEFLSAMSGSTTSENRRQIRCYLPTTLAEAHAKLVFMLPGKYRYALPSTAIKMYAIDVYERASDEDGTPYNEIDEAIIRSVRIARGTPLAVGV